MSYLDEPRMGNTQTIDAEHDANLKTMNLHGNYFKEQEEIAVVNLPLLSSIMQNQNYNYITLTSILYMAMYPRTNNYM